MSQALSDPLANVCIKPWQSDLPTERDMYNKKRYDLEKFATVRMGLSCQR